jgi:arginine/serine-rich splicing factor 7
MRVYVGGLSNHTEKAEVEREFKKFGSLRDVWVARNPPGFAFLEFDDPRDAEVL